MQSEFKRILLNHNFTDEKADKCAEIFATNSLEGIYSHGVYRFFRFVEYIKKGFINVDAEPELVHTAGALEQWKGNLAPGPLNAEICANRSMEIASKNGIGCVAIGNTNHWMRGGTYGWRAAEEGFLFMAWTNTTPNMPPWGGDSAALGNNPFILAIPHRNGHIVLDMAMSQYSYGKLEWHQKCGTDLPEFGGYDRNGQLTKDPSEILETERILPTGLWKGSALSLALDLAAAILSGGNTTKNIGEYPEETNLSQVFIAINIERHLGEEQLNSLINETLDFITSQNESAQYPGQRSLRNRKYHLENGVEIPDELWKEINQL